MLLRKYCIPTYTTPTIRETHKGEAMNRVPGIANSEYIIMRASINS